MASLVSIYIIPKNAKDTDRGDTINVYRSDNNLKVKHYDHVNKKRYELLLTNTSLGHYVGTLCKMFVADTDPFEQMQFNFHGFPTFMAKKHTLTRELRHTLEDVADIVHEGFLADVPVRVECDDCGCETDEDSEDSDDDEMPPLVPADEPWERHY
jgi:hypothetical protein